LAFHPISTIDRIVILTLDRHLCRHSFCMMVEISNLTMVFFMSHVLREYFSRFLLLNCFHRPTSNDETLYSKYPQHSLMQELRQAN
jgi:hypothetical protein